MTQRPKSICPYPGCTDLTDGGRCPEHRKEQKAEWQARRKPGSWKPYSGRWRRLRLMVLARDPICMICRREQSTDADHVVARSKGGDNSLDNLQGLCHRCHSRKTATEDGAFGNRPEPGN